MPSTRAVSRSAAIRGRLGHPVIDADGHFLELSALFAEDVDSLVREIGGREVHDRFRRGRILPWDVAPPGAERDPRDSWRAAAPWWGWPTGNTVDRATVHLPRLLYERLGELGIDFAVLYPSHGLSYSHALAYRHALDPELAQVVSRAINTIYAETFRSYSDRMVPVASIPMHTPAAAVEELDYAVERLRYKAVRIGGYAVRPIPRVDRDHPELFPFANRFDTFGIDSEHDYDPFWARCVELRVAPVTHSSLLNRPTRSVSSYVYNHIGGLAEAHAALLKSLFLGGVVRRFPRLRVGFLEGGVAWACALLADLVGHWEKRNVEALLENLDPARIDVDRLIDLVRRYGEESVRNRLEAIRESFRRPIPRPAELDEWAACGIEASQDIATAFARSFYFGCEGDDRTVAWAFRSDVNPFGAKLAAMFGSDIGHWDVPDMASSLAEAYELVEKGILGEADFREFTFVNAARLHAGANPDFFEGTACQAAVAALQASGEVT